MEKHELGPGGRHVWWGLGGELCVSVTSSETDTGAEGQFHSVLAASLAQTAFKSTHLPHRQRRAPRAGERHSQQLQALTAWRHVCQ